MSNIRILNAIVPYQYVSMNRTIKLNRFALALELDHVNMEVANVRYLPRFRLLKNSFLNFLGVIFWGA